MYLKFHHTNILLLAENVKNFRGIKKVESTNYQELTEHERV